MVDVRIDVHAADPPDAALAIRRRVFVAEQGVSPAVEFDDGDDLAHHLVASVGDEPVGTARVRPLDSTTARVERVAVLPDYRGSRVGTRLVRAAHEVAREQQRSAALVHAQARVRGFYESLGYEYVRDVADETDIPHVEMTRRL